jgi:hypothetical protein
MREELREKEVTGPREDGNVKRRGTITWNK